MKNARPLTHSRAKHTTEMKLKTLLWGTPRKDGYPVYLRATYRHKVRYFSLKKYCQADQWNEEAGRFRKNYPGYKRANDLLAAYEKRAADYVYQCEREGRPMSFDDLKTALFGYAPKSALLVAYIEEKAAQKEKAGKYGTGRAYRIRAATLKAYQPNATLSDINEKWLSALENWLRTARKAKDSSIAVLLSCIRTVANMALKEGIMPDGWQPFKGYSMAHLKANKAKKAAGLDFIRALEAFDCPDKYRYPVDLFLLSFYFRGMNLADMLELTPANVIGGRIVYVRKKTGREYSIPINEKARALLERNKGTGFLIRGYIPAMDRQQRRLYISSLTISANKNLRAVADLIGFQIPGLSFYTARHTYATALKNAGVSVEVISEALGHSDVKTTDAYLQAFGSDVLDRADELIL